MVVRHLTDDEIQAYLDLRAEGLAPDLMDHLETCGTCRAAVRAYQALYARLADDRGFEAPPGFAANVIARLNLEAGRQRLSFPTDIAVVAGAIACMVVIALAFLDLNPIIAALAPMRLSLIEYGSPSFESARSLVVGLNHRLTLAVAGLTVLALMGVLDAAFRPKLIR